MTLTEPYLVCLIAGTGDGATFGVVRAMHRAGFAVLERPASESTLAMALSGNVDLVMWACPAPDAESLHALSELSDARVPVIAVVEDTTTEMLTETMVAGADACVLADTTPAVIEAQAMAVMRRYRDLDAKTGQMAEGQLLQVGDLTVDIHRCEVVRAETPVLLTEKEFRVVAHMARNAGRVLKPHDILNAVTDGYTYGPREAQEVFKVTVGRIRRKLEPNAASPRYLVTVRGFGYRLDEGAPAQIAGIA